MVRLSRRCLSRKRGRCSTRPTDGSNGTTARRRNDTAFGRPANSSHVRVVTRIVDGGVSEVMVNRPEYVAQESRREDGYIRVSSPDGEAELRWQALDSGFGLRSWLKRYESALLDDEVKAVDYADPQD